MRLELLITCAAANQHNRVQFYVFALCVVKHRLDLALKLIETAKLRCAAQVQ